MLLIKGIFFSLLVVLFLYILSIRPRTSRIGEVLEYNRSMFAHRGYHSEDRLIPENSMAAFRAAIERGYGIELDVHITRDRRLAVFHDDTLDRMCRVPGRIESYTFEELQKFHLLNTTEKIPELGEVLAYVNGRVPLLIELKIPGRDLSVCPAALEVLKNYRGRYLIQSFNTMGLYWYRRHAPQVLRGQLSSNLTKTAKRDPYILRFLVKYLISNILGRPDFISYKLKDLPNLSVFLCRGLFGTPVAVWTLRTEKALKQGRSGYNICIFERTGKNYSK